MATITLPEDTVGCCRTCLNSASPKMYDIFNEMDDIKLAEVLTTCTTIQIDAHDESMPKKLCRSCYHCLTGFYDFKRLAEDIDRKLHERFNEIDIFELNKSIKHESDETMVEFDLQTELDDSMSIKSETPYFSNDGIPESNDITRPWHKNKKKINGKLKKSKVKVLLDIYTCPVCSQQFKYHNSYKKHVEKCDLVKLPVGSDQNLVNCDICAGTFKSVYSLAAHKRKHVQKNRILECKFCGKVFKKISHLKRHELCHEDNKPFKCPQCQKSFVSESSLGEHVEFKHKGKRPYPCPICPKAFAHALVLSRHMRIHTSSHVFLCSTCGKKFDSSTNLKQHVKRHLGLKEFVCDQCPKKFVSKGELASHKVSHTGLKAFSCEQCGSTFSKNCSLRKHKVTHLGVKPFKCETCPMRFTFKQHLIVHNRIHTGEKPYRCDHCDRTFAQTGDLLKHKRRHFGDHMYKCDECGESFRLKFELREHISKHYVASMGTQNKNIQDEVIKEI